VPVDSDDVVVLALPFATDTGAPIATVPSMKVTVPVRTPVPVVGPTLAVNTTAWPGFDEVGAAVRTVVVGALLTCSVTGRELLEPNVLSPE